MNGVRCERCGGIVTSPTRRVPLWDAVEHHEDSCPSTLRIRKESR